MDIQASVEERCPRPRPDDAVASQTCFFLELANCLFGRHVEDVRVRKTQVSPDRTNMRAD